MISSAPACGSLRRNSGLRTAESSRYAAVFDRAHLLRFLSCLLLFLFAVSACPQSPDQAKLESTNSAVPALGNEACGKCHQAIAQSYASKPMARASGPATQDFFPGDFRDSVSGVQYRVYLDNGSTWLSFDRDGENPLHGKRKLEYFIGSGHRGKTFIFSDDGFSFESPINFYSRLNNPALGVWDMQPKARGAAEMPLNAPAASSCLSCHASDAQSPEPGTENKYPSPLFAHGGITCERCHGSDLSHGSRPRKFAKKSSSTSTGQAQPQSPIGIINPAKLSPSGRDEVCMQCHLEGNVAIEQPGRHLYEFRPGNDLSQLVHYYVLTGDGKENVRAVSQFEALAQSQCKRATGDAMTCTTCHDPHASPDLADRASYYRAKCLSCHGADFGVKHHPERQDCTSCHMPRVSTADVGHTQDSDHRILRVPLPSQNNTSSSANDPSSETKLTRFPPANDDSLRGVALAWMSLAGKGSQLAMSQAEKLLPEALAQSPEDPDLLTALGFTEQQHGLNDQAREHFQHALRVNPLSVDAAADLALIEANSGNLGRAASLWASAFARAPGRIALGINLARAQCLTGHIAQAKSTLARLLDFNPDSSTARTMTKQLETGEVKCDAR